MSEGQVGRLYRRYDRLRRREFIAIAGSAFALRPVRSVAQQSLKPRIAIVIPAGNADEVLREDGLGAWPGFLRELRRLGYVEGTNLVIERYSAKDQREPELFDAFIGDVVSTAPTLIVTVLNSFARSFAGKTKAIPIVAVMADPVENGLVPSLAHPGGNLTGVSTNAGMGLWGKRVQIIKDVVPSASRIAYFGAIPPPNEPNWRANLSAVESAGERLGLSVTSMWVAQTETSYHEVFGATGPGAPDAIVVSDSGSLVQYRGLIAELAAAHRVPAMFPFRDDIERGALMAYGTNLAALGRQLAAQVAKILGGAKPADTPIEQASRFVFALNLKTAAAMNFTVPPAAIAEADEVIE